MINYRREKARQLEDDIEYVNMSQHVHIVTISSQGGRAKRARGGRENAFRLGRDSESSASGSDDEDNIDTTKSDQELDASTVQGSARDTPASNSGARVYVCTTCNRSFKHPPAFSQHQ